MKTPKRNETSEAKRHAHKCVVTMIRSLVVDCLRVFLIILMKRKATSVKQMHRHDKHEHPTEIAVRMRW